MNWTLISHPVNWLVVLSMILLAGYGLMLLGSLLPSPATQA